MPRILVIIFLSLPAAAQTQIDLRTQTKSVDFTGAVSTRPLKAGSVLPATCQVGDMFFKTDASAGSNLYGCTATNAWSIQAGSTQGSLTVKSDDSTVGQRNAINFEAGAGIVTVMTDNGSEINVLLELDTAVVQTPWGEQAGSALLCAPTGGSGSSYHCLLQPTLQEYATGMTLHWTPDVDGAGGPTSLNVDTLGAVPVKQADGIADPSAAQIPAGRMQTIWYDGTNFRLPTTGTVPTIISTTSVLKGDGSGNGVAATSGIDYAPATSGTSVLKANGAGGFSSAVAGTDYQPPGSYITGLTGDVTANGPGGVAVAVTKVNGGSIPASATLVGTDSSGKFTSLAVTSLPATCTPGGAPSVVAYTAGGSTQVCSCTGTNTWTCGASANSTTNGTNGQALTSNGSGAFGTAVTTTATPSANAIPQSGAAGTLAAGWLPFPAASAIGGVKSQSCSGTGHVLSINTDGTVTCSADAGGGGTTRTWTYSYRGIYQSGPVGFAANLPTTNAPSPTSVGGTDPAGVLEWPCYTGGGCGATWSSAPYAYWSFVLPTGYTTNAPISYTIESRSTDSTHAAILTPSWNCVSTATVDAPNWTAISAVNITGAGSSGRVVTTGTITPTCAAGNEAFIKFSINTNTNSMTGPFDLIGVTFSVQGGM